LLCWVLPSWSLTQRDHLTCLCPRHSNNNKK